MKIIVISDTHMPKKAKVLPPRLLQELPTADLIIHAGDWQTMDVYEEIKTFGMVHGVTGNVDSSELKALLPEKVIVEVEDVRIGVVHGHGKRLTTERRAIEAFADESVDCIIFGHSHIPINKQVHGILLFNPGSCTDKRRQPQFTFGILTVEQGEIVAKHVAFDRVEGG